jgi:single-strand DNA-binding protein
MINKVILVGNVGRDPEIKHLDNNVAVATFSLATSESYKNKNGEKVTNTEWHNIVLWRGLADIAEKYIRKGSQIYVEGKIRSRSWDDKDGNKRYTTEILGETLQLLGRPNTGSSSAPGEYNSGAQTQSSPDTMDSIAEMSPTDDLPF